MLDYARAGDTVELGERGIVLRALREGVDTGTPTGRAVAAIMATLAELELELGRERRASSRDSRRARQLRATKPPNSVLNGKNSFGVWPRLVNPCANSLLRSGSDGQPPTVTYPRPAAQRLEPTAHLVSR